MVEHERLQLRRVRALRLTDVSVVAIVKAYAARAGHAAEES